tara:strand:- start:72 stop:614 length:543 start_codon:yes stop_codon:yes gene_type:complete
MSKIDVECILCYNNKEIDYDEFIFYTLIYKNKDPNFVMSWDPIFIQKEDTKEYLTILSLNHGLNDDEYSELIEKEYVNKNNVILPKVVWKTENVDEIDTFDKWWYLELHYDRYYIISYQWTYVRYCEETKKMIHTEVFDYDNCVYIDFSKPEDFIIQEDNSEGIIKSILMYPFRRFFKST